MVFQKPNPFPTMSIFDNVAAGLRLTGTTGENLRERVHRSLRAVGLWGEVKNRLNEPGIGLSGGQQQRLCIARTIAVEPEVILMDEPCSALDPVATLKVEELIDELKERYTIVIVTHNMQQAARVADSTAFMLDGELVEHAPDERDLHQPEGRADRALRHRKVRLAHDAGDTAPVPRDAQGARGPGARRPRPRHPAARPRARVDQLPGRRARRDGRRRRRPDRRPLPRGPPGDPLAARPPGAGGGRSADRGGAAAHRSAASSGWATSA